MSENGKYIMLPSGEISFALVAHTSHSACVALIAYSAVTIFQLEEHKLRVTRVIVTSCQTASRSPSKTALIPNFGYVASRDFYLPKDGNVGCSIYFPFIT
jgi:hypothetical protein